MAGAVVVVGGGFAGLTTALKLSQYHPRPPIILIEPRSRFVFLPLLYELLTGELQSWEVAPTYQSLLSDRGIVFVQDRVERIDTEEQTVFTASGLKLKYLQVVVGTGSESHDFDIPGVQQNALKFQCLEDVDRLRGVINALKTSKNQANNVVVVGGGASGVELACKLSDLLHDFVEIHLIELGERILPQGKSFNREQAQRALRKRGVKLHLCCRVTAVMSDRVECETDLIESQSISLMHNALLWTAGTKPCVPEFLPKIFRPGRKLVVNEYLQVVGFENIFAIGDIAFHSDNRWPNTAQVAIQQGEHVAKAVLSNRLGESIQCFEFFDQGEMLSLGLGEATMTGLGFTIAGPLAFQIRRMTYLTRMPNRLLGLRSAGAWLLGS